MGGLDQDTSIAAARSLSSSSNAVGTSSSARGRGTTEDFHHEISKLWLPPSDHRTVGKLRRLTSSLYPYKVNKERSVSLRIMTGTDVEQDPILAMRGVGRELWEQEPGDAFVERMRSEDITTVPAVSPQGTREGNIVESIWRRIEEHEGEQFQTVTGLPFTFALEGTGMWFFRDGKRVNRKMSRRQIETAVSRCPLSSTTEIKDLIDYPYLFAILKDGRIRRDSW